MTGAAAVLAFVASACGPQVQDTTLVVSSDPELKARASELLPDLADRAGMELVRPIRVEWRTRDQLERYLLFKLDQEFPPEEARHLTRTYSLVGLVDEDLDLRDLLVRVYEEQVAGFYDPDSTALFVMEDMPEALLESVLLHELVHAVQDQTANLDSLTAEDRGNDRQVAAQSAIEGHATLIMMEYMAGQGGQEVDFSQLPDISQMMELASVAMQEQYPALASAPAIIQEGLLFPYVKGGSFMSSFWKEHEGRPPPFGVYLPQSTEQILDPSRAFGGEIDHPTEVGLEVGQDLEVLYGNTFGQAEFEILLETHLGSEGRSLAGGWDGDRYALVRSGEGTDGLIWGSVWDSEEERNRFLEGFQPVLGGLTLPAVLEAVEVEGRPGAVLRIGVPSDVEVTVRIREVTSG
jgi:hypothetical protein